MAQDLAQTLEQLFDAERHVRTHHGALAAADGAKVLDVLAAALMSAQKQPEDEANLRLVRIAELLAEIPEPGVLKLLGRFLKSEEPDVVASAIEALAQTAEPDGIPLLTPLTKDKRVVSMEDGEGDEATVTLGELAKEAIDLLQSASRAGEGGPARGGRP